jgi:hypothetical protein
VDAFTIKELMGHSTITISHRYVHPSQNALAGAVAKLEALTSGAESPRRSEVPTNSPTVIKGADEKLNQLLYHQPARVAESADAKDLKVRSGQSLFRATLKPCGRGGIGRRIGLKRKLECPPGNRRCRTAQSRGTL